MVLARCSRQIAVTNTHGVLAVLCSLAGICNLVVLGAAGMLVAGVTHGGLGDVALPVSSPARVCNPMEVPQLCLLACQ